MGNLNDFSYSRERDIVGNEGGVPRKPHKGVVWAEAIWKSSRSLFQYDFERTRTPVHVQSDHVTNLCYTPAVQTQALTQYSSA